MHIVNEVNEINEIYEVYEVYEDDEVSDYMQVQMCVWNASDKEMGIIFCDDIAECFRHRDNILAGRDPGPVRRYSRIRIDISDRVSRTTVYDSDVHGPLEFHAILK